MVDNEQQLRKQLIDELREQIRRDEDKLYELDKTIAEVRRDVDAVKHMIESLRKTFSANSRD